MSDRPALGRPARRPGTSRAQAELYAQVAREEPECWLAYPGFCTRRSRTGDHVISWSKGGTDTRENLHGACHACNQHRGANPRPPHRPKPRIEELDMTTKCTADAAPYVRFTPDQPTPCQLPAGHHGRHQAEGGSPGNRRRIEWIDTNEVGIRGLAVSPVLP